MNCIKLSPKINNLYKLNEFINGIIQKEDFQVDLILEEVFVNIVNYSKSDSLSVQVDFKDNILTVEFVDNGVKFNPILKEYYNAPENIDDAKIGGVGIHLTRELSDDISYEYINGENHLKIVKKVE